MLLRSLLIDALPPPRGGGRGGDVEGMQLRTQLLVDELFIMIKLQLYFSMFKKRPVFMREYKNKTRMIGRIWKGKFNCILEDSLPH